jgi:hypothetical protein
MSQHTPDEYDALERAITHRTRVALYRRGRELVVLPVRLRIDGGREILEATHPSTGEPIWWFLDDLERIEAAR